MRPWPECLVNDHRAPSRTTLERTPPELSCRYHRPRHHPDGRRRSAARPGPADQQSETGIDVHVAEDPLDCVAKGAGAVLDHVDVLHDVLDTDGAHM